MKKAVKKVNISKGSGGFPIYRAPLPIEYVKALGITQEDRNILVELDEEQKKIIITKITL